MFTLARLPAPGLGKTECRPGALCPGNRPAVDIGGADSEKYLRLPSGSGRPLLSIRIEHEFPGGIVRGKGYPDTGAGKLRIPYALKPCLIPWGSHSGILVEPQHRWLDFDPEHFLAQKTLPIVEFDNGKVL